MSIEKGPKRGDGSQPWRVRWRDPVTGKNRAKTFDRKRDALAWDAKVRDMKRLGELGLYDAGRETLADFGQEWFQLYVVPKLAPKTAANYALTWDTHILPALGHYRLRDITPRHVDEFLAPRSGLSPSTQLKLLATLQSCLQRAVEWGRISNNPVKLVRKPKKTRLRSINVMPPDVIEHLRAELLAVGRLRDATIVSVLGYCGLRPGELRGLKWDHVGQQTLHIEQAISADRIGPTKTRRNRTVPLPAPVARDLAEWRMASSMSQPHHWVFPAHGPDRRQKDKPWTDRGWNMWNQEVFKPLTRQIGLKGATSYDLRHSAISLWIHDAKSILQVAKQAGHSATMTLEVYGHIFDEFDPERRVSAEEAIRLAREKYVPNTYPKRASETA